MKALLQAKSNYYLWQPTVQTSLGLDVRAEENEAFDSVGSLITCQFQSHFMAVIYLCFSERTFLYAILKQLLTE